jgi:hypothetical protein
MTWKVVGQAGAMILLGVLGMGAFQVGSCAYKDLSFLHKARLINEQPRPQPKPVTP